jgi:hypothetical protein
MNKHTNPEFESLKNQQAQILPLPPSSEVNEPKRLLRVAERKSTNKYLRYWCVEERIAEPNPLDIWHIVVPWSNDEESIRLKFGELSQGSPISTPPPAAS